ncbi:hypothetical protein ACFYRN_23785 [Streptomyces sp. NPDC005227]|uniref:hypothetical protein n=2 Tax=unclassified Streptomyces TaxID=2593676 RepID=UPI0036972120
MDGEDLLGLGQFSQHVTASYCGSNSGHRPITDLGADPPMNVSSREIRLQLDEVLTVLRDLNEFVVSLDRIGSRQASGTAVDSAVGAFVADWDVARRLANARRVISVALDTQLSEEENAEIDALCEQGRFYGTDGPASSPTDT